MNVYDNVGENLKLRLEMIDDQIKGWQKEMQNPTLSTFVEFVQYAEIVAKLNKERMLLRDFLRDDDDDI